jgi:homoserine O-acetyltransferase
VRNSVFASAIVLLALAANAQELSDQKLALLGDFRLENGETMRECRVGYRTAGELNADRSNAILVPTWFAGRSGDLKGWIGPGKLLDTKRYHVIAVDAFGDSVSSSPSNSTQRPFPTFTIRDMVRSQYELVTRELKLQQLYAVVGLSMGGMQAFQWIVSYPNSMKKAVPIVGTTKQTSADVILWKTELDLLESFSDSPENLRKAMAAIAGIQSLELRTPAWLAQNVADGAANLETHRKSLQDRDPHDYMSQLRAMLAHDVGPPETAAKAVKARVLVIVALQDQMVNPGPARQFAKLIAADVVTLTGDCGHLASGCERDVLMQEVKRFLGL